jgi:hypothetical protein
MSKVHSLPVRPAKRRLPQIRAVGELLGETRAPREVILGPWLKGAHLSMVYAPTGVGKSFFALSCGIAVAGGGAVFGWSAPKPRKVLLVDGEMDREDIAERTGGLIPAIPGADPAAVKQNLLVLAYQDQEPETWFPTITDPEGQDYIARVATEHGAELVILDNLSTLARVEDENSASAIDPVIDLLMKLKRHGLAVMVVHHARKNSGGDNSYRGSQKIGVTFQTIIRLAHPDGVPSYEGVAFDLTFEKMRELRTAQTEDLRAKLPAPAVTLSAPGEEPPARVWVTEVRGDARLRTLAALVRSLRYTSQEALAAELKVSPATLSGLRRDVTARGLMKDDEWRRCIRTARDIGTDAEPEPTGADATPF